MSTNLTIHVNTDTDDLEYGTSGVEWTEIDSVNDLLIFSAGNPSIADGQPFPSSENLNQAGIRVGGGAEIIVDKHFLADQSENELKEIHNMGNQNKRYVIAFDFDGETTSEPVLEAWDDSDMNSFDLESLGGGVASSSWLRGVVTTDGNPGSNWTGLPLAGSASGHYLLLNNGNGALSSADTLYCNLKLVIPSTQTAGGAETPLIVCKYTTN